MFIWDFVADTVLGQIIDWMYVQIIGFLGDVFMQMGNMGADLFTMSWVQLVPIIQSFAQLQKNYSKEGSAIIIDNCQDILFGGFAPNSESADILSRALGNKTVMSGSISRGKNDPSQSLQMIQGPLMIPDELKTIPKGSFILAKTGCCPMRTKLPLFLKWGIQFEKPFVVEEHATRKVAYADRFELEQEMMNRRCAYDKDEYAEPPLPPYIDSMPSQ